MAKHALSGVEGFIGRSEFFKVDPRVLIIEDGFNPRDGFGDEQDQELKASINENGVQVPLKVQKSINGDLVIRDGGRRHWACMQLISDGVDIKEVPIQLIQKNTTEDNALFLALITNTGKPFKPYEEAQAFSRLKNHGHSVKEIAKRIGKTEVHVYERLKLINMTHETKQALESKQITIKDAAHIAAKSGGSADVQRTKVQQAKKKTPKVSIRWNKSAGRYVVKGTSTDSQKEFFDSLFNPKTSSTLAVLGLIPESMVVNIQVKGD